MELPRIFCAVGFLKYMIEFKKLVILLGNPLLGVSRK